MASFISLPSARDHLASSSSLLPGCFEPTCTGAGERGWHEDPHAHRQHIHPAPTCTRHSCTGSHLLAGSWEYPAHRTIPLPGASRGCPLLRHGHHRRISTQSAFLPDPQVGTGFHLLPIQISRAVWVSALCFISHLCHRAENKLQPHPSL